MSLTKRTGAVIERVDAAAVAAVIKLDILTLIIIRGRRSQRLKVRLLALVVWDETGGRCRITALMEVAQVMLMLMLRLEVLIRVIRVVWMGLLLMVLMVLLMLLSLLLICDNATVDAAVLLLPRRVGMRGGDGGGGGVSHFRAPGNPRSFATEGETERRSGRDLRSEIVRDRLVKMGR